MADHGITTPLLYSHPSDPTPQGDLIMTVHSDNHQNPQNNNGNSNPYEEVLGCSSSTLVVPPTPTIDPFRNATPRIEGVYEVLKIVWCLPIAVLRGVFFGACLLVGFCATKLALLGWKDKHSPMPMWRRRIMLVTRVCARCILFSFGYHWIRRKGKPAPRDAAPIVVSNHVSYIEPIFYFYEIFPTILASESHDPIPFVGTIIRAMQVIYVDRFSPSSRKQAVNEIKRRASCDNFPRILLFPEGTTTNGRVLISFQLGAFIHGYPIQPVTVRYPHVHFDQSWGHISLAMLVLRMFMQFHNFMEVEYLPVIYPLGNPKETAAQFAARTSRAMATSLNVVQTSHSYGDLRLLTKASQSQKNPANFMVEMAMMELSSHVNTVEAVEFLDRFLSMDPDPSGRVGYSDFLRGLKLKPCSISEKICWFIDVEKMGAITFKQFLYGSVYVRKQPLFRQACELAFAKCAAGGNNFISEDEFGNSIRYAIPDINKDEIGQLFNLFDTDGDGRLSKDDFLTGLRVHPLLIALFSPCLLSNHMHDGEAQMFKEIV